MLTLRRVVCSQSHSVAARAFCTPTDKKVLIMGLSGPAAPPGPKAAPGGLTKEKIMAMLAQQNEELRTHGIAPTMLLLDPTNPRDDNAAKVTHELGKNAYDVVSIGAGVRTFPEHFLLFECLVNVVHQHAPNARIAFDTAPDDKVQSILRHV